MFAVRRAPVSISVRFYFDIVKSFEADQIVPDVIDVAPHAVAKISYPSGCNVNLGNILTPTQTKELPTVTWEAKDKYLYTLCMTDPDAPCRKEPKFREWHHWLVGNIPGQSVLKGDVLSAYVGSGPPKGTGLHRYIFLIYKQATKMKFEDVPRLSDKSADKRGGFSIKKFATKYQLGFPIAANYYQAEYDCYVPILYKQLEA